MKTTRVSVNGGAAAVEIPCTIPCKFVKIVEDSALPTEQLVVQFKQPDHSYASEVTYSPGTLVVAQGYSGIIARPAGYSASGVPASNEALCKIRTASGNVITVRGTEYEEVPPGVV
jgi:hypothetical protein